MVSHQGRDHRTTTFKSVLASFQGLMNVCICPGIPEPGMRLIKASPDDDRQLFWETPRYLYNRFNGEALVVTCLFEGDIALANRAETDEQQWHIETIHNESIFRVVRNKFSNFVLECAGENYPLIQVNPDSHQCHRTITVRAPQIPGPIEAFKAS